MHEPRSGRPAALGATFLAVILLAGCGGASSSAVATPEVTASPQSSAPAVASASTSAAPTLAPTPVASDGQTAGQTRTDASGIEQVWVPAGTFTMGTDAKAIAALEAQSPPDWVTPEFPSEEPAHEVTLTKGYWIDKNEVTNAAFSAFVDAGGYTNQSLWSTDGWTWLGGKDTTRLPLHCQGDVPEHPRLCLTWFEAEAYAAWRGGRL